MPVKSYYRGNGLSVMRDMIRRYGLKKGRQVFYARANATGLVPGNKKNTPKKRRPRRSRRGPTMAARRKGGRAAARSRKSPIGRRKRSKRRSKRRSRRR